MEGGSRRIGEKGLLKNLVFEAARLSGAGFFGKASGSKIDSWDKHPPLLIVPGTSKKRNSEP